MAMSTDEVQSGTLRKVLSPKLSCEVEADWLTAAFTEGSWLTHLAKPQTMNMPTFRVTGKGGGH